MDNHNGESELVEIIVIDLCDYRCTLRERKGRWRPLINWSKWIVVLATYREDGKGFEGYFNTP